MWTCRGIHVGDSPLAVVSCIHSSSHVTLRAVYKRPREGWWAHALSVAARTSQCDCSRKARYGAYGAAKRCWLQAAVLAADLDPALAIADGTLPTNDCDQIADHF